MGISQALGNVGQIPVGSVVPFAGTAAPANWLLCAGQAVSRVDFAGLFLTIGTTYGAGNGSTTFNVPDLRGRVVAGVDNMNGSAAGRLTNTVLTASNTIGATGGAQTHLLSSLESGVRPHIHTISQMRWTGSTSHTHSNQGGLLAEAPNVPGGTATASQTDGASSENATNAHNNTQPTLVMNYLIRAV